MPELLELLPKIKKKKIGLIFSDEPVFELKPRVESDKVKAAAKIG